MLAFGVLLLCAGSALAQSAHQSFTCPKDDGFYSDPNQCDKYYDCYRGTMEEKLCPDGLVFDYTLSPKVEQCNYPFIVPCPDGSTLQPPKSAGIECPRLNGFFEHEDETNCEDYYECTNGLSVKRTCHSGLVFDEFTGTCQWKSTGLRTGCVEKVMVLDDGFKCPLGPQAAVNGHVLHHSRHPHPTSCRDFYVCAEGKNPTLVGCPEGSVFNDVTLNCDAPENVQGCQDYYSQDYTQTV